MNGQIHRIFQHIPLYRILVIGIGGSFLIGTLLWLNQPLAAVLVPLIMFLLMMQARWRGRVRTLAWQLMHYQSLQKFEVPRGEWGNLYRALNRVTQSRRIQQRVHTSLLPVFPDDAIEILLDEKNMGTSDVRSVVVLSIRYTPNKQQREDLRDTFDQWREFMAFAQQRGQQYNALIQPCGDGYMLVFGAFQNQSMDALLATTIHVAEELRRQWSEEQADYGETLHMYLTSGPVLIATVSGIGCCVFGTPVQQVLSADHWIPCEGNTRLLCCADTYMLLQHKQRIANQASPLAIAVGSDQSCTVEMVTPTTQLM